MFWKNYWKPVRYFQKYISIKVKNISTNKKLTTHNIIL